MARKQGGGKLSSVIGLARGALNVLLPPACPVTDQTTDAPGRLAAEAWSQLRFLSTPWCEVCGTPFAYDPGPGTVCGACLAAPPDFDRGRAAVAYDDASRPLILAFKHGARTDVALTFARWMDAVAGDMARSAHLIIPVPLHPARLRRRRFNQAGVLARSLARMSGRPFDPDSLARRRATPTQAGLTPTQRAKNVSGAFVMRDDAARNRLAGARVLLVDDVYTTGATLSACARTLKRAGAARVDAVAVARVVRGSGEPI